MLTPEQIDKSPAWLNGPMEIGITDNGYFTRYMQGHWRQGRTKITDPAICLALDRKCAAALRAAADQLDPPVQFDLEQAARTATVSNEVFEGSEPLRGEALAVLEQTLHRTTSAKPKHIIDPTTTDTHQ